MQKLHSCNEAESSTLESSDSDSLVAVSVSVESGSDTIKQLSDIISIENSSYSESEADKVDNTARPVENIETVYCHPNDDSEAPVSEIEKHCPIIEETSFATDIIDTKGTSDTKKVNSKSNNNEYCEAVEDILLASSDEETGGSQEEGPSSAEGACINLRDDLISIDETIVGSVIDEPEKAAEKEATMNVVDEPVKLVEEEPSVTIPEKVSSADEPSVVENSTNDDNVKDDNKVAEKTNAIESISVESSQEIAPSALKEESAQNEVSVKAADTVSPMDVDEVDQDQEKNSIEENNLPSVLSSQSQ